MDFLAAIGWRIIPTIDLGPISVSPHGLGIAVGYGIGGVVVARRAERMYNIDRQHIWNMLTWAVLGVIVGARLFFVVGHLDFYFPSDPLGIFKIWQGGIVFYGGAIGGVVAAYPYARRHGFNFWQVMDAAAPGFPIGLIFGRIGDLIIGDHLGGPTSLPFGFRYQGGALPGCPALPSSGISCPLPGEVVHATALYDLWSVLLLLPVVLLLGRKRRFDGFLIAFTVTWYAAARFASDYARSAVLYGPFRGTQWVSFVLMLGGLGYLLWGARRQKTSPPRSAVVPDDPMAEAAMVDEGAPIAGPDDDPSEEIGLPAAAAEDRAPDRAD